MFFVVSVCNNYAFNFNIPMPLHMIFRAVSSDQFSDFRDPNNVFFLYAQGSLMANMVMGILILKKEYDFLKYLSVILITAGIITCTVISGTDVVSDL